MNTQPLPREQHRLVGHDGAEHALLSAFGSGRLHHAWLLTGPPGIGKETLAFRFARWLLAGQPDGKGLEIDAGHGVFRRVAAGTHADLLTIARGLDEKKQRLRGEIVADDVRAVPDFLRRTAAEGGWRVVVVDSAEFLNRNAANALLKVLEEPPARAVLLLTTSAPGRLLPTIRSRCRVLRLDALGAPDMATVLAGLLPDLDDGARDTLIGLAGGSPGQAVRLAGDDGVAMEALVREALQAADLPAGRPDSRAYQIADLVQRREGGFSTFLTLLTDAISGRLRDAARQPPGGAGAAADAAQSSRWMSIWQEIRRMRDETERFNLDKRQALLSSLDLLSPR